ncbi:hypothetical protein CPU12_03785 [Malaciobacter molluscorum LMG 25693]|uniref:Uncharacterized protein n=1 Tax=Malaciobacter molluscorum LMG 25693 TaxID=870501 RepID=A0A2G1DJL6_9BACT|nr:hypothetical protein [Malaciobacter molluscorum]AXX92859.1 hypothetical protein AMOL_1896 [Malaciobacter molluscorum LMG 25693]PHO18695.1 hypothetical protein CPU12_03785 [Malaciobacter molluscorum LMG 25693]
MPNKKNSADKKKPHQFDIALALASSAVDATASKYDYKGNSNAKYKQFLKDNMQMITTFGFPGISASGIRIKKT